VKEGGAGGGYVGEGSRALEVETGYQGQVLAEKALGGEEDVELPASALAVLALGLEGSVVIDEGNLLVQREEVAEGCARVVAELDGRVVRDEGGELGDARLAKGVGKVLRQRRQRGGALRSVSMVGARVAARPVCLLIGCSASGDDLDEPLEAAPACVAEDVVQRDGGDDGDRTAGKMTTTSNGCATLRRQECPRLYSV
jgi:hypothetical protein